jgi:hypothetical protein
MFDGRNLYPVMADSSCMKNSILVSILNASTGLLGFPKSQLFTLIETEEYTKCHRFPQAFANYLFITWDIQVVGVLCLTASKLV